MARPRFLRYVYYHCTKRTHPQCSQRSVGDKTIEDQIQEFLGRLELAETFRTWALKHLNDLATKEFMKREAITKSQRKAHDESRRRMEHLLRLKTSPQNHDGSLVSDEEYIRMRMELLKEQEALSKAIGDPRAEITERLQHSSAVFDLACAIRERFRDGDSGVKKEILSAICSNLRLADGKLSIEARKPFKVLGDSLRGSCSESPPFEPTNQRLTGPFLSTLQPQKPQGRALGDDVRTWKKKMERAAVLVYTHFKNEKLKKLQRN